MSEPITQEQIKKLATAWFYALDIHAPIEECYKLLADPGLRMIFPDGDINDLPSFKVWYDRVTNIFFDENHYVNSVVATISGDEAEVDIIVGWQASVWNPPEAKSKRVSMNATQKWKVRRSTKNAYGLEITSYNATAKPFEYAPGFSWL